MPKGAPHLVDPSRLLQSAERIYGDEMGPLWGRVVPVPERNLRVIEGGETVAAAGRDFDVAYTPGHASHHVVYFDTPRRDRVRGRRGRRAHPAGRLRARAHAAAGHRRRGVAASPSTWSLDRGPARLALTHFGIGRGPGHPHLAQMKQSLDEQSVLVRELLERHGDTDEAVRSLRERGRAAHARRGGGRAGSGCSRSARRWSSAGSACGATGRSAAWRCPADAAPPRQIERPRVGGPGDGG